MAIGYSSYGKTSYGRNNGYSSYGKSSWSYDWGSYYGSSRLDNNDDLFVKESENYITPTSTEIERKTGQFKKTSVDQIKELALVCYYKMIEEKEYINDKFSDFDSLSDENKNIHTVKKEFYDKIFDTYIPGFTPLEQAIAIFNKMKTEADQQSGEIDDQMENSSVLDFDRELYTDADINEQLMINEENKDRKMNIMNHLSIIGDLGNEFKVEKEISEKIVSNSNIYSKKMMRDYSQLANVDLYQKLFPNFNIKMLTKDLVVNVPVERKEQKQKIIILLDFSGSMDEDFKQDWVNALLIDRFKYVMRGEAEVFFSYFVHDPEAMHFQHIHDRASVIKFWQTFSNEPNGGTTKIEDMVRKISDDIIKHKKLHNLQIDLSEELPEILIINDGEDHVSEKPFPYKVNAVCLGNFNEKLKNLCVKTKGKKISVSFDSKVVSYSEAGEEKIN
jgi:hypothetical protein